MAFDSAAVTKQLKNLSTSGSALKVMAVAGQLEASQVLLSLKLSKTLKIQLSLDAIQNSAHPVM